MLEIEEFKKMAEPNFFNPVFSAFKFLKDTYDFKMMGNAVSYETSVEYTRKDIHICIFHAFPETPILILKRSVSGKIINEKIINRNYNPSAKKAALEMQKMRDRIDIEMWCDMFRSGSFNDYFSKIINDYALLIKTNINTIIGGNFKLDDQIFQGPRIG